MSLLKTLSPSTNSTSAGIPFRVKVDVTPPTSPRTVLFFPSLPLLPRMSAFPLFMDKVLSYRYVLVLRRRGSKSRKLCRLVHAQPNSVALPAAFFFSLFFPPGSVGRPTSLDRSGALFFPATATLAPFCPAPPYLPRSFPLPCHRVFFSTQPLEATIRHGQQRVLRRGHMNPPRSAGLCFLAPSFPPTPFPFRLFFTLFRDGPSPFYSSATTGPSVFFGRILLFLIFQDDPPFKFFWSWATTPFQSWRLRATRHLSMSFMCKFFFPLAGLFSPSRFLKPPLPCVPELIFPLRETFWAAFVSLDRSFFSLQVGLLVGLS